MLLVILYQLCKLLFHEISRQLTHTYSYGHTTKELFCAKYEEGNAAWFPCIFTAVAPVDMYILDSTVDKVCIITIPYYVAQCVW